MYCHQEVFRRSDVNKTQSPEIFCGSFLPTLGKIAAPLNFQHLYANTSVDIILVGSNDIKASNTGGEGEFSHV